MSENEMDRMAEAEPCEEALPAMQEDADSVDLAALLHTLHLGKNMILGTSLTVFGIATLVAFLLPFRYTSSVSFIPPNISNGNSIASAIGVQLSALGGGDLPGGIKSTGDLYAGILKSRSIADELIVRCHLMDVFKAKKQSQAEKMLASATVVAVDAKSSIVTVEVTANSPQLAQELAGDYMDALREMEGRLALGQSSQRRLFFGQQLAKEKDDLEDAEVELKKTEEQSGLIAPAGQTEVEIGTIAQTQAQIAVREVQLAALSDSATEQNPEVVRLRSEIEDLKRQLSLLQKGSANKSSATIPTSEVPALQLDYVRKEREVKYHEALFDMLSRQYEAARLDEARDAPVLQVLDTASLPDTKSAPKRSYYMAGGLVFGFIAGCIWVLARGRLQELRMSLAARQAA
jgi:uncharacterized protein involved in exopolysaccharide biosynthesis